MMLTNLSYHKYDSLSTIYYRYAGKKCIQARRMKARIIRKRFTFCEVWSIIEKDGVFRQKTFFALCPQKASLKFLKNQQNLLHFLWIYVTIQMRIAERPCMMTYRYDIEATDEDVLYCSSCLQIIAAHLTDHHQ